MPRFWKRSHHDPIETLLQANRPEPRSDFAVATIARLTAERRRVRTSSLRSRVLVAGLVTAVAAGAAVAAGGASTVSNSVTSLVDVAKQTVNGNGNGNGNGGQKSAPTTTSTQTTTTTAPTTTTVVTTSTQTTTTTNGQSTNDPNGNGGGQGDSPGDHQYAVPVCHHTGSSTNPWIVINVSPQGAANHVVHDAPDFIIDATHPCPPA
jgi:hypothetical protein